MVGKLLTKVELPVETPLNVAEEAKPIETQTEAPKSEEGQEKMVTIKPLEEPTKKRRLKKGGEDTVLNVKDL